MIEMRISNPQEIPAMQELFRLCFGDGPEYSDLFFRQDFQQEYMVVLLDEGTLLAMAGLLPCTLTGPEGLALPASYLYALATHPDAQGRGYAGMLLNYADFYLRGKADCFLTVPARPGLHPFFQKAGFEELFPILEGTVSPRATRPGEALTPVDAAQYEALREALLAGTLHVTYGPMTSLQQNMSEGAGGGLYCLEVAEHIGCAAVERWHDDFLCKELLIHPDALEGGAALVGSLRGGAPYVLRIPGDRPEGGMTAVKFGMIKWYDPNVKQRWAHCPNPYLGLAFD